VSHAASAIQEIEQHLDSQKKLWMFQRLGIVFMFLFVGACLLGVLGPGAFSKTIKGTDQLQVEFQRFLHYRNPSQFRFKIARHGEKAVLFINRDFIESVDVKRVNPEPESVISSGTEHKYVFATDSQSKGEPVSIVFAFEAETRGRLQAKIRTDVGAPLRIDQFVYP
jgi:hypothetical protein